jgi:hypothetical protein
MRLIASYSALISDGREEGKGRRVQGRKNLLTRQNIRIDMLELFSESRQLGTE